MSRFEVRLPANPSKASLNDCRAVPPKAGTTPARSTQTLSVKCISQNVSPLTVPLANRANLDDNLWRPDPITWATINNLHSRIPRNVRSSSRQNFPVYPGIQPPGTADGRVERRVRRRSSHVSVPGRYAGHEDLASVWAHGLGHWMPVTWKFSVRSAV